MGYDERREIFERLEALERLVRSRHDERAWCDDDRHRERCDRGRHDRGRDHDCDDFDEKRIIDTIVRLVSEHVGRLFEEQQARSERRDDGGGEKRIVDLIVGLVSEHVREIIAMELDRRFGRPAPRGAGDECSPLSPQPPPPGPPPPSPPGGSPGPEQR